MKEQWRTKLLGDVLRETETVNPAAFPEVEFDYVDVSSVSNETFAIETTQRLKGKDAPSRARRRVRAKDVLFATIRPTLKRIAVTPDYLDGQVCSTGYFVMRPNDEIDSRFLFHYLFTEPFMAAMASLQKGASYPAVSDAEVRSQTIMFPPIGEQRQIVAILDEAFEGIATAKAHAEINLRNAREVLDRHLAEFFSNRSEGWSSKAFEDCIEDVKYTNKIQRKDFLTAGAFPVISQESEFINGYWDNVTDVFKINSPLVVFGDHTQVLKYIDFDFVLGADGVKLLVPKAFLHPKFFYYALRAAPVRSLGYARHYRLLKELQIGFPSIAEQASAVDRLDKAVEKVQRLGRIYAEKMGLLAALKQSLLHQAFNGRL